MTEPLYLNDSYLFQAEAKILNIAKDERGEYLILNQTIFYPQGGGQPSDKGTIIISDANIDINFVKQFGPEIRHYTLSNVPKNYSEITVQCIIDEQRRKENACYHTAAHLISNIVESIYPNMKACKGHSFPNEAYVEFNGADSLDQKIILDAIDSVIKNNLLTKTFEISSPEFEEKYYKLPYLISGNKAFRAMQIDNFSPIPCGGTHVQCLSEIKEIIIRKISVKNNITKIAYEVSC